MGDGDEGFGPSTRAAEDFFVCDRCFGDDTLSSFIRDNATELACDFCGRTSRRRPIATPLDQVVEIIIESVEREYDAAANNLGWESAEGGYYGKHWDTYDLLTDELEIDLPNDDGRLFEIISNCLGDQFWCERNPYSLRKDERLVYSWENFSDFIKHERRYFFLAQKRTVSRYPDEEMLRPAELLEFIGSMVKEFGLVSKIPKGTLLYRARHLRPGDIFNTPYDLGPPPKEKAIRSNRMSPAGIVMLYGSDDPNTAAAEIDDDPSLGICIGTFRVTRDIWVLDLTHLPRAPTFYENDYGYDRYAVAFLNDFVGSVAAKVIPGPNEHIDYVPTQVVTEWFRSKFRYRKSIIDGICYPSTQRKGGKSLVLFARREHLILNQRQFRKECGKGFIDEWWLREQQKHAWLKLVRSRVVREPA